MKTYNECVQVIKSLIPNNMFINEGFRALVNVVAYTMSKQYEQMDYLSNVYNVGKVDDDLLSKLADTLDIDYPIGSTEGRLRLLLKYYNKILKNRGTLDSIKQMVRILELTEEEVYDLTLSEYSNVNISQPLFGVILIKTDLVSDLDFAKKMLRKVIPAGYRCVIFSSSTGPNKGSFEAGNFEESPAFVENVVYDNDEFTVEEIEDIQI
jgi:P2-related tail formation protein